MRRQEALSDEIGDADATNGRIGGCRVAFDHWLPQGGKR
jgi:hypothetical protein